MMSDRIQLIYFYPSQRSDLTIWDYHSQKDSVRFDSLVAWIHVLLDRPDLHPRGHPCGPQNWITVALVNDTWLWNTSQPCEFWWQVANIKKRKTKKNKEIIENKLHKKEVSSHNMGDSRLAYRSIKRLFW